MTNILLANANHILEDFYKSQVWHRLISNDNVSKCLLNQSSMILQRRAILQGHFTHGPINNNISNIKHGRVYEIKTDKKKKMTFLLTNVSVTVKS